MRLRGRASRCRDASFAVDIHAADGVYCAGINTLMDRVDARHRSTAPGYVDLTIPRLPLLPGYYLTSVGILDGSSGATLDLHNRAYPFSVMSDRRDLGVVYLDHEWTHRPQRRGRRSPSTATAVASPAQGLALMIAESVVLEAGVVIHHPDLVNLYGCRIGAGSRIGTFVEIQRGAVIGRNCKISSHTFICEGVTLEDGVFVGHGVMFTNDLHPRAVNADGSLQTDADWTAGADAGQAAGLDRQQRHDPVPASPSAKARWSAPARWSPGMCPHYAVVAGVPARVIGTRERCTGR